MQFDFLNSFIYVIHFYTDDAFEDKNNVDMMFILFLWHLSGLLLWLKHYLVSEQMSVKFMIFI